MHAPNPNARTEKTETLFPLVSQLVSVLVLSLREVLQQRLLHPGANTSQIIDVYVAAIKALRLLDPTGVLLESVSESVKDYLRGRHDTVRCIVGSLTDDTSSDLFEELGRGESAVTDRRN